MTFLLRGSNEVTTQLLQREGNHYGLPSLYHRIRRTQEGAASFAWKTEGYQRSSRSWGSVLVPSPGRSAAPRPPLRIELRRGTPARKSNKGKAPGYSPKLGEAVYRANRASCHRHPKAGVCSNFTSWVVRQIREHRVVPGCLLRICQAARPVRAGLRWSAPAPSTTWSGKGAFPTRNGTK